jgi:hypothetical protein
MLILEMRPYTPNQGYGPWQKVKTISEIDSWNFIHNAKLKQTATQGVYIGEMNDEYKLTPTEN